MGGVYRHAISIAILIATLSVGGVHAQQRFTKLAESCTVYEVLVNGGARGNDDEYLTCELLSGRSFKLGVSKSFIKNNFKNKGFKSGKALLKLQDGMTIDNRHGKIRMPNGKKPTFKNKRNKATRKHRKLVTGNKSVLAVRVIPSDGGLSYDDAALSDSVFGTSGDPVNLSSQFAACSYNELTFQPFSNSDISDGVVTVNLPTSNVSSGDGALVNDAITALTTLLGTSPNNVVDYVMFCVPSSSMSGIAYAYLNGWRSVYNDNWCRYVSAQMHEIGHNLNLHHAGENGAQYADQSGMMGYSYGQSDGPIMCFNSAKMWQLGWYGNSRRLIIDSDSNDYIGPLVGIVDQISGPYVIKLEKAGTSYFMNFNKKASFNSGTVEGGNQVLITEQAATGISYLLAKLSVGQSWTSPAEFAGEAITVTVTDIDVEAIVQVCVGTCGTITESPSMSPSAVPSSLPSGIPTMSPSAQPSLFPSGVPSLTPSVIPSLSPSKAPSTVPSVSPSISKIPSQVPTMPPSAVPSSPPSGTPTSTPSDAPSEVPSKTPTKSPTLTPSSLPSGIPTSTPSDAPSEVPSKTPTESPTLTPSLNPSLSPSENPSTVPSVSPSISSIPSQSLSSSPSMLPSSLPSGIPTSTPSLKPSLSPSETPSTVPSVSPSISSIPSQAPTMSPSMPPSSLPSGRPSFNPSVHPSSSPSESPSGRPSFSPSVHPSSSPSESPSGAPSSIPTIEAPPTICQDNPLFLLGNKTCKFIAKKKFHLCKKNKLVQLNCKESCELCPSSCEDSSSKIPGYSQTCKNVQSFNLKKYKKYCSRNVVHKHCPETCGKCLAESSCVDANEINKTCLWIHFKQSRLFKNCGKTFIKFQCPSTCNQCMNL